MSSQSSKTARASNALALSALALLAATAHAQLAVTDTGTSTFTQTIIAPPGVGGMSPKLSLTYLAGAANGPIGAGWSIQGLSMIARCPATLAEDQKPAGVAYAASDKLCLDGQRLIQTDESGSPTATSNSVGIAVSTQANDAQGLSSTLYREFRTERDMYGRIRAYGYANGDTTGASGPAYFKVWYKSGEILEYGAGPSADANTNALITRYATTGTGVPMAWAVARTSDPLGNYIDFKYEQRNVAWGSGTTAGSPTPGRDWNIKEIQYSGNKVVFTYKVDGSGNDVRADKSEAYQQGTKTVTSRLLGSITTYVNSANTSALGPAASAVAVKSYVLDFDTSGAGAKNRVAHIKECAGGPSSTRCLPPATFSYSAGGGEVFKNNAAFASSALATTVLQKSDGTIGVIPLDVNGDGKTDLLRVGDSPSNNQLWLSNGDGTFTLSSAFSITLNLNRSDSCYMSFIADVNGDGLPDIIRFASTTNSSGTACGTTDNTSLIFINNGDGSFTQKALSGVTLKLLQAKVLTGGCSSFCTSPPFGMSQGFMFYLMDVNGDGMVDIVTAEQPAVPIGGGASSCTGGVCTHVYLGNGSGAFSEVTTNLASQNVYTFIDQRLSLSVRDLDGDGLLDFFVTRPTTTGSTPTVVNAAWRSRGDGNFDATTMPATCSSPIDFNGDGRSDCVTAGATASANSLQVATSGTALTTVAGFNLQATGQEFTNTAGSIGIAVADFNGDGRQDILRWEDDPTKNTVYLSNGDGTFTASTAFNLGSNFGTLFTAATQLRKSDGSYGMVLGDFTGNGSVEILRTVSAASSTTPNLLLGKADPSPPDMLTAVTTPTGIKSSLYYVPLGNAVPNNGQSASLGSRYTSDLGNTSLAVANAVDLTPSFYVVATNVTDAGIGGGTVATEYSYLGFKRDKQGRGPLGFREVRVQQPAPNGEALTVDTQYMQFQPYTRMQLASNTYRGALNATSTSSVLKSSSNVFCDRTNVAAQSSTAHCPVTAKVARPYVYQTTDTAADLLGVALPQVVTNRQYTDTGDPVEVDTTTSGTVVGVPQTFAKSVVNRYDPTNTACSAINTCAWVLGRVNQIVTTSTVPNSLSALPTSAGTSSTATATKGNGP